jgi:RNA polymerase sigma factor (sigma-70 family)
MDCNTREEKALRLARAVKLVLAGDVNAYEEIYAVCDGALRAFTSSRYGRLGGDFVDEVVARTHEYAFSHLNCYNSDRGASFQTWLNWQSRSVAWRVRAERYEPRQVRFSESEEEDWTGTVAGPAEAHEADWSRHLVWQEYNALANEARLAVALHDIGGRSLPDTARELGMPLIRLRRLLERNHSRLRKRLRRQGVRPVETGPHYGRVWHEPDDTGYDDDWTATPMAELPVDPDSLVGAAEQHEEEDREQTQ